MLWIHIWIHGVLPCGFPHSDICGSTDICSSPQLFAAYHVFLRLLVPRHPPCALSCLTSVTSSSGTDSFSCSHSVGNGSSSLSWLFFVLSNFIVFLGCLDIWSIPTSLHQFFLCEIFKVHFRLILLSAIRLLSLLNFRITGKIRSLFFFNLAATCSPMPSPA